MKTIPDKSIENQQWRTKLDASLKSSDFFDAAKFPTAKFVTTSVVPLKKIEEGESIHTVKETLPSKTKSMKLYLTQ